VLALIDLQSRGRQFVTAFLDRHEGVRVAGFVLTRQDSPGKWSPATYALKRPDGGVPPLPSKAL
jgi:hypothetical protein